MNYNDYKLARDMSWKFITTDGLRELPVDIVAMCHRHGIQVKFYDGEGEDGKTELIDGSYVILLSSRIKNRGRRRFTVAHELGHIVLGHVGRYGLVNREPSFGDNPIEQAANVFASRLLAPACVLWGCNAYAPEQIMQLCDISRQAAEYRAVRMQELLTRGKFLSSPHERAVYNQFYDYIQKHKL